MSTGSLPPADVGQASPSYSQPPMPAAHTAVTSQSLPPAGPSPSYRAAAPAQSVRPDPVVGNASNWTATGGASVTVGEGETAQTLGTRYGVPASAIIAANNLRGPLAPGSRVIIPVYAPGGGRVATASPRPEVSPRPGTVPAHVAATPRGQPAGPQTHYQLVRGAQPAATAAATAAPGRPGSQPTTQQQVAKAPATAKAPAAATAPVAAQPLKTQTVKDQAVKPVQTAKAVPAEPLKAPEPVAPEKPAATASAEPAGNDADSGAGAFRWPARGRIIAGFSAKGGNEGINIAVPEGTPVKAAEGGTVAYAGSELKGYGNLVLIRHDNGWVSAYANNGELLVKRGEKVKRGQTVAKSGQSGNVASPQLHFELRKGATPVDPVPHLAGS